MRIVGIDYGRKKIGLAISEGILAEPFGVLLIKNQNEAVYEMSKIIQGNRIDMLVIGVSESKMGEECKLFGKRLEKDLNVLVKYQDETLTTQDADRLAKEAGINQKKRKKFEDAYAATLILQTFLDNK